MQGANPCPCQRSTEALKEGNVDEGLLYMVKLYIQTWGMMALITGILLGGFGVMVLSIFKKYKEWPAVAILAMGMTILFFYMRWL